MENYQAADGNSIARFAENNLHFQIIRNSLLSRSVRSCLCGGEGIFGFESIK